MKQQPPSVVQSGRIEPSFVRLAKQLLAAGRPIPVPLVRAVDGEPIPLALSTRDDWPAWAALNGYDAAQTETLIRAVGELVHSPRYIEAVATDLAERVDYDGKPVERVTREHALAAALMLNTREMRKGGRSALHGRGAA